MAEAQMKQLVNKRTSFRTQLNSFDNYFKNISNTQLNNAEKSTFKVRLEKLEAEFDKFNEIQTEIEGLLEFPPEQIEIRTDIENKAYVLIGSGRQYLLEQNSVANLAPSSNSNISNQNIKLPTIELPSFNGNFTEWRSFEDAFLALIDKNETLTNIHKLCYLRSALKGEALSVIQALETTDTNYEIALQLITERYSHNRRIIYSHVNTLLNLKTMPLKSFTNIVEQHIRSLKSLKLPVEQWDAILIPLLIAKLDQKLVREWESKLSSSLPKNEIPTYKFFLTFLLEKSDTADIIKANNAFSAQPSAKFTTKSFAITTKSNCPVCKEHHFINHCKKFLKESVSDRIKTVKSLHLCLNCLRPGHVLKDCKSSNCKECGDKHNTFLHLEKGVKISNNASVINETSPSTSTTLCSTKTTQFNQVLLSTAEILILDKHNKFHNARALLDCASQSNFITKDFFKKLNIKPHKTRTTIIGINRNETPINNCVTIKIASKISNYSTNISCLILDKISENLPHASFPQNMISIPNHISLADRNFNKSRPIDLLIGVNIFWNIIKPQKVTLGKNLPVLQNTHLGWIVGGHIPWNTEIAQTSSFHCCELNEQIQNLWKLDEICPKKQLIKKDDEICEIYFNETTTRDETGRFIVKIPFNEKLQQLGNSKKSALKRFYALEARLNRQPDVKQMYSEFLKEYSNLGHMSEIKNEMHEGELEVYLPHHHVIRENSSTTKLRVVFDGSLKTTSGVSLNEAQYTGPTLQSDLYSILLRFRQYKYIATADINKMYRQVFIHPSQRDKQQIFWRENPEDKLKVYQLNTVTYGTASAPYLAVRCLFELARINKTSHPVESKIIESDFYVDDLLTGSNDINELKVTCNNILEILSSAGFQLHKWNCNSSLLESKNIHLENKSLILHDSINTKTLGIRFSPSTDTFHFALEFNIDQNITKRTILSAAAKLFDPLGVLSPLTVTPKIIIQKLWKLKYDWDQRVPVNIEKEWRQYLNSCKSVKEISIPRHCIHKKANNFHLYGFADASESAYGACIYVKSLCDDKLLGVELLTAKSRVAPVKNITLPRLELCAATLLAQLSNRVEATLHIKFSKKYYFSDSQITLAWINGCPSSWKTFVANRVSDIQTSTHKDEWYHVSSNLNPADAISRGMSAQQLKKSILWWQGPKFIHDETHVGENNALINDIPERRTINLMTVVTKRLELFSKISSFTKLINIMAYCKRFINNCKKQYTASGKLTLAEKSSSLITLIKVAQYECFPNEINALRKNKQLPSNSTLLSLNPKLDEFSVMRVGGRLQNSNLTFNERHQIILPYNHSITKLIAINEHKINLHCGAQQLLYSLRQRYWPIKGKSLTKTIIHKCLKCYRVNPKPLTEIMGNLPHFRVTPSHPFSFCGIDYAGPFLSRSRRSRGYKSYKVYICLFICLSTKAIHLELVEDLSSEAFLASFRRFVARRGKPKEIYSDNATNFIGANNQLRRLQHLICEEKAHITNTLLNEGTPIEWKFIPPRSPNFGGIWESAIKIVKRLLTKVIGNTILTFSEFYTILTQIEAIINSRPISPLSDDPKDLLPLTPAHFLIGTSYTAVPDESVEWINENRLNSYQRLQKTIQHFWRGWSREYLHHLQTRTKWKKQQSVLLKVGSLVLVIGENEPPSVWKLGRISELHPGKDGKIRVVSLITSNGTIKRSISKICAIPIDDN